jgi:hypothetical protein
VNTAFTVLRHEDQAGFDTVLDQLRSEFQPATSHESFLVELMATARWRIARLQRIETAAFDSLAPAGADPRHTPESLIAFKFENGMGRTLATLQRMMTAAERTYHKAHTELARARQLRNEAKTVEILDRAVVGRIVNAPPPRTAVAAACARVQNEPKTGKAFVMNTNDNPALRL